MSVIVKLMRTYGLTLVLAFVLSLSFRFFAFESYRIPSSIMMPTLYPGDLILVAKWPFGLRLSLAQEAFTTPRLPKYGEIVTYVGLENPGAEYIKRAVGLPGDRIEIKAGRIILNESSLKYTPDPVDPTCGAEALNGRAYSVCIEPPLIDDLEPMTIPEQSVFVIGDFRRKSSDAKNWEVIPFSALRSLPKWVWLSVEPPSDTASVGWVPSVRFDRVFRAIR